MRRKNSVKSNNVVGLLLIAAAFLMIAAFIALHGPVATADSPDTVFSNPANIAINNLQTAPVPASPYPSTINVSGLTGTTTKVTVTLSGLTHPRPGELDLLLVGPNAAKFVLMSDTGSIPANNITLIIDDSATQSIPGFLISGTYRPTDNDNTDTFPSPAPPSPYRRPFPSGFETLATSFNGADPNGIWNLFIVDDYALGGGTLSDWSLSVTTTGSPATVFSNGAGTVLNEITATTPYPSTIEVSGLTGVVTNLKVTLVNVTHANSNDIDVLLVSPNGAALVVMSDAGNGPANNVTLTFDDTATVSLPAAFGAGPLQTGTYKATDHSPDQIEDSFPFPAPPKPYLTPVNSSPLTTAFGGFPANGTWSLYVVDDFAAPSGGAIAGGWSLDITTGPYTAPVVACAIPSFTSSGNFPVGSSPTGIAAGDFNNDTKQDLVVSNQGTNNISVLLGDGLGGFGAATNFPTGTSPYSVAVGDFNTDSKQDVVVVNSGSNNVSVLLGDGMGGFGAPANYGVGISPISVAVGDLNNDGKPDLAVANFGGFFAGTASVLINSGTGGVFGPATNYGVRTQPSFVAIGDFNGDSNRDLAVANFGSGNVSILMGTGTGSFLAGPPDTVGAGPVSIAIADYNSDGKSDMAVVHYNLNYFSIRLGTGTGSFTGGNAPVTATNPISIVTADLNGDGKPDLAVAHSSSNNVRVFFNDGSGIFATFVGTGAFDVGAGPNALVAADFDGDGEQDLATANSSSNNVSVLLNSCAVAKGNLFDFDGDRRTDFAVYRPSKSTWLYLRSAQNNVPVTVEHLGFSTYRPVPEDYDGDGLLDIGYFGPSNGTWFVPGIYFLQFGLSTDIPVPADFDGDGRADIAVYRPSEGTWYIRRSLDSSFAAVQFGSSEDKPIPRDFDGDGKADVAVFRPSNGVWYVLQSSNGQVFGLNFGISEDRPVAADYDGDGKADIAVFRPSNGVWYMLRSADNSFFAQAWGISIDVPVPGDYDGDGRFDFAVWRPSDRVWYILGSLRGPFQTQFGNSGDIPVPSTNTP